MSCLLSRNLKIQLFYSSEMICATKKKHIREAPNSNLRPLNQICVTGGSDLLLLPHLRYSVNTTLI